MNCANHADASAVAYCRTCGKALCEKCMRPVRGVIYCEDCLEARIGGVPAGTSAGSPGFVSGGYSPTGPSPAAPGQVPPPPPPGSGGGPNPTVAGILAGFFPFGVGAVYTGQYAKGLAHLAIFVLLIAGCCAADSDHFTALGVFCGLGIAFFYVYQIIDSVAPSGSPLAWRQLLGAEQRSRPAKSRWARSCSFCWACCSCCTPWA